MTEAQLTESKDRPKGPLKITTTVAFGSHWLAPRMSEFIEIYPEIECHLLLLDREVDLSMREADLAIRFSPPRQADLVHRHLMTVNMHIYAAASYLKKHSVAQTTKDLHKHRTTVSNRKTAVSGKRASVHENHRG